MAKRAVWIVEWSIGGSAWNPGGETWPTRELGRWRLGKANSEGLRLGSLPYRYRLRKYEAVD